MRSRYQNHAWADRDETQRRAQIKAHRQRTNNAGEQRRAERLQERIAAIPRERAAQNGAGRRTRDYEHHGRHMLDSEEHRQGSSARRSCQCKQPGGRRRRVGNRVDLLRNGR